MEIFNSFIRTVAELPDWAVLLICPAVLVLVGLLLAIFRADKAYLPVAVALGGAGVFLTICSSDIATAAAWAGLYVVLCVLVRLLFLIPFRSGKGERDTADALYEKFHADLDIPEQETEERAENVLIGMEESGLQLDHVFSLLQNLRACELSAGDRLETDAIYRTLDVYRGKNLTAEEMGTVNDCLASVLKLTAKYKL